LASEETLSVQVRIERKLSWSSTSRSPRRLVSPFRSRYSAAPTRWSS